VLYLLALDAGDNQINTYILNIYWKIKVGNDHKEELEDV
jgi:hypothetical protein